MFMSAAAAKVEKDPENPTVVLTVRGVGTSRTPVIRPGDDSDAEERRCDLWLARRTRSRWGGLAHDTRHGCAESAVGIAWRRSLQLRVVALTLGLSLAVILALGFVLTSQLTIVCSTSRSRPHRAARARAYHRRWDRQRRGDAFPGQQSSACP